MAELPPEGCPVPADGALPTGPSKRPPIGGTTPVNFTPTSPIASLFACTIAGVYSIRLSENGAGTLVGMLSEKRTTTPTGLETAGDIVGVRLMVGIRPLEVCATLPYAELLVLPTMGPSTSRSVRSASRVPLPDFLWDHIIAFLPYISSYWINSPFPLRLNW